MIIFYLIDSATFSHQQILSYFRFVMVLFLNINNKKLASCKKSRPNSYAKKV